MYRLSYERRGDISFIALERYIYIYSRLTIVSRSIGPVMPERSKLIHKSRFVRMDMRSLRSEPPTISDNLQLITELY